MWILDISIFVVYDPSGKLAKIDSLVMQDGRDGFLRCVFPDMIPVVTCTVVVLAWTVEYASYVAGSQSLECGYVTRDIIRPVVNAYLIVRWGDTIQTLVIL